LSTTEEDFEAWLRNQLNGQVLLQKVHTIQRLYEKIRLIHNAVGRVYRQEETITDFQTQYPVVFDKIKGELQPYVEGGYLTRQGWEYFLGHMFDPRHNVIIGFILQVRKIMRETAAVLDLAPFNG
jgi:hypothetical protein